MKVRIEFGDREGEDLESTFDVVEFGTVHAGTYEDWASAVWDFCHSAGSRWNARRIIIEALTVNGGYGIDEPHWAVFAGSLSTESLLACLSAIQVEIDARLTPAPTPTTPQP